MAQSGIRKRLTRAAMRSVHAARHRAQDAGLVPADKEYSRFVCVTYARSGSTLLMRSLNNHSRIIGFGEIVKNFDRYPAHYHEFGHSEALFEREPARFLDTRVFRRYPPRIAAVGFKIFYHHAPRDTAWGRSVWEYLLALPDLKVLHLKRRNKLKTLLSEKQAAGSDEWIKYSGSADKTPVRLEPAEALAFFERMAAWEAECEAMFAAHPFLEVIYETLAGDYDAAMARILDFLAVEYETVSPGTEKRPGRPMSSQIANYQELKEFFRETQWAEYFAD